MTRDNHTVAQSTHCRWWDYLRLSDQYLAPHHLLGRMILALTRIRTPWFKNRQIRWFIRHYQLDLSEVAEQNPDSYADFNAFFTRALKSGARPIVNRRHDIACPVDGTVSQAGFISAGQLFQAKGRYYDVKTLLGGSDERAAIFRTGSYATLYLSPRDYHRVHMPVNGRLRSMSYIPGRLFSVAPRTTRNIPQLFARNERLVTLFDTEAGPMALVMVGAMFVSGIETVWTGNNSLPHYRVAQEWDYAADTRKPPVILQRGAEFGRFNMGSTVIVLFTSQVKLAETILPEAVVRMGQLLATWNTPAA